MKEKTIATIISSSSALVHIHWNDLFIVSHHTQQLWTWTNLVSDHVCPGQETVCTKWNNRRAKLETIGLLQEVIHVIKDVGSLQRGAKYFSMNDLSANQTGSSTVTTLTFFFYLLTAFKRSNNTSVCELRTCLTYNRKNVVTVITCPML